MLQRQELLRETIVDDTQSEILETIDCKYVINLV